MCASVCNLVCLCLLACLLLWVGVCDRGLGANRGHGAVACRLRRVAPVATTSSGKGLGAGDAVPREHPIHPGHDVARVGLAPAGTIDVRPCVCHLDSSLGHACESVCEHEHAWDKAAPCSKLAPRFRPRGFKRCSPPLSRPQIQVEDAVGTAASASPARSSGWLADAAAEGRAASDDDDDDDEDMDADGHIALLSGHGADGGGGDSDDDDDGGGYASGRGPSVSWRMYTTETNARTLLSAPLMPGELVMGVHHSAGHAAWGAAGAGGAGAGGVGWRAYLRAAAIWVAPLTGGLYWVAVAAATAWLLATCVLVVVTAARNNHYFGCHGPYTGTYCP